MTRVVRDFKFVLRVLVSRPLLSGAAVLTLALGIGATSAVMSVVHAVLLKPLPYEDAGRLVVVRESHPGKGVDDTGVAPARFVHLRDEGRSFAGVAAARAIRLHLTGGGEPLEIDVEEVSAGYFRLLGIPLVSGREFVPGEQTYGEHRVTVLSWALWQSRFGGDPEVVGRTLVLGGETYGVVGVAAAVRDPLGDPALWVPLENVVWANRVSHSLTVIGRLAEGTSLEAARATRGTNASSSAGGCSSG